MSEPGAREWSGPGRWVGRAGAGRQGDRGDRGDQGDQGNPADLLQLACRVAVAAGRLLIGSGGHPEVVATKSSPTDVVTEADRAAEALIRDLIGDARPGERILGEEGGETGSGSGVRWIVDPLDGTVNYLYGLPDWAVSVAAEVDGAVVAGAVFVPRRDELFSAGLGGGAWLSSGALDWRGEDTAPPVRLACNTDVPLDRALVATGFGYEAGRRLVQGEVGRPPWTCARWPRAAWTPTTSGASTCGTSPRAP
jgi:myo-inositol-1(or 4)-monophosphatase